MRGVCIAYDGDKEVAWMYVDENGNYKSYNDEGALYVVSEINMERREEIEVQHKQT